ncbi:MAG: hypothetical protein ACLR2G_13205 [Phascolarctobacterium faecium]
MKLIDRIAASIYLWLFYFTVVAAAAADSREYFTVVVFNSLLPVTIMESAARPFSTAILLDQQKTISALPRR